MFHRIFGSKVKGKEQKEAPNVPTNLTVVAVIQAQVAVTTSRSTSYKSISADCFYVQ